jgi:phosphoribosyl-ATP pyrophosphohydrolase
MPARPKNVLKHLASIIEDRKIRKPKRSYTVTLFQSGTTGIATKLTEEVGELIEAANNVDEDRTPVVREAADLFYHLLVLLTQCGVSVEEVEQELESRLGVSGLEEKASRPNR